MLNLKSIPLIGIIFFALFSVLSLQAQVDDVSTELLKPFKAKLAESSKKTSMPILPPLDTNAGKISYEVPEHLMRVSYPEPTIRPLAMPAPKPPLTHSFYAKAGIGFPISPLVELSYHNKQNKNLKFGTNFRHHSSQGNVENQVFGNTHFDLGGTYQLDNGLAFGAKLGFNLDAYRYYGYHELSEILPDSLDIFPDSVTINKDSISQRFFEFFGNIHLFNGKLTKSQFNYSADVDVSILNDKYGAKELVIAPKGSIEKWLGTGKQKHRLFGDLYVNLATFNNDSISQGRTLLNFRPGIDLNFGIFKASAATNLGANIGKFYIFPDVKLGLFLAEGMFNVYGGWSGQIRTNTFRSLSLYNPFISSDVVLRHTSFSEIFGGLSGNIKGIGYDFRAGYAMTKDMPIFLNDSTQSYLRFNVLYDNLKILNFKGTLDFRMVKNLVVMAAVGYNIFIDGTADKAYHLPTFTSNFTAQYTIQQLLLKAEVYFNAGVPYFDILTQDSKVLGGLFDVNLGASYWFGKKKQNIGAFVEVNNILNNKNQRWYLYPQLGFNAKVGILAKF